MKYSTSSLFIILFEGMTLFQLGQRLILSLGEKSAKNAVTPLVEAFQRF